MRRLLIAITAVVWLTLAAAQRRRDHPHPGWLSAGAGDRHRSRGCWPIVLAPALGETVIVENRPGQGGSIALASLSQSPPDGRTMVLAPLASMVVNPHMYKTVGYDTFKDLAPVALVADLPLLLVVNPSLPVKTVPELIAYAKANPDKLSHPSSGNGTLSHLGMEVFKQRAGITILHVPYRGSVPAMVDLMAGIVNVAMDTVAVTEPFIRAGKMRLIASAYSKRVAFIPGYADGRRSRLSGSRPLGLARHRRGGGNAEGADRSSWQRRITKIAQSPEIAREACVDSAPCRVRWGRRNSANSSGAKTPAGAPSSRRRASRSNSLTLLPRDVLAGDVAERQRRAERDAGAGIIAAHDARHVVAGGIEAVIRRPSASSARAFSSVLMPA